MGHIIIGTAGHIDHGKTTLVKALTGRDTDRLEEEKRRGITIDLGFTWLDLPDGERAGIIDVPGHEKFIRNMAAGASGMDLVLLVVAADEGVMPQTREHLEILDLLGVRHYIAVLNKCDLADGEWLDMVEAQIREELGEILGRETPVVRVSAKDGAGIEALKAEIGAAVRKLGSGDREDSLLRLPVDRVFTMPGFGTVVTGTVLGGRIRKDDILSVYPSDVSCRVRGIQVYNEDTAECTAGQRAALNLTGTDKQGLGRGCVLARPHSLTVWKTCHARLNVLKSSRRTVKNQMRLHLYSGTSEMLCRAVLLDAEKIGPGESGLVRLHMETDAVMCRGDRFAVRFYSPVETIGGGVILETGVRKEKRFSPELLRRLGELETAPPDEAAVLCLDSCGGTMVRLGDLARKLALTEKAASEIAERLAEQGRAEMLSSGEDTWIWTCENSRKMQEKVEQTIRSYTTEYPYRTGMPASLLYGGPLGGMDPKLSSVWMERAVQEGRLERSGNLVKVPGYSPVEDKAYQTVLAVFQKAAAEAGCSFVETAAPDFGSVTPEKTAEICRLLKEQGKIVEVVRDVWTTPEILDDMLRRIEEVLEENGKITISQVRDMFGTGRKNVRRILEYTDRTGITRKDGGESERVKNR